jgi:hypothetical protein
MLEVNDISIPIELPMQQIAEFCQRWQVIEFALFGSVLRDDFVQTAMLISWCNFTPMLIRGLEH